MQRLIESGTSEPEETSEERLARLDARLEEWLNVKLRVVPGAAEEAPFVPDEGPYCPRCRGFRFLRQDVAPTHSDFGKPIRCPECADWSRAAMLNRLANRANLSGEERSKTFASLRPIKPMEAAIRACGTWATHPDGWLLVHGGVGSGKTHLALAVANELIRTEHPVIYWYTPDLLRQMRKAVKEGNVDGCLEQLMAEPVLVLDDFAAARGTDFEIGNILEPLADFRYRKRLPTMFTCIGSPAELKRSFSESIGRRMEDPELCKVVHNAAPQWGLKAR